MDKLAWVLVVVLAAVLLVTTAKQALTRAARRRTQRRRGRRARQGEQAAASLLDASGYRVIEAQPAVSWIVEVDNEPVEVALRADYLVARGGRELVAEVKTGSKAPSVTHSPTRRQLLEYAVAYDVDGVLLVDMETATVHSVEFGLASSGTAAWPPGIIAVAVLAAFVAGVACSLAVVT